jgi:hypothetical protein
MPIKTIFFTKRQDGVNLVKTYSDRGFDIIQNETNIPYEVEAIDVGIVDVDSNWIPKNFTYSEIATNVETDPNEATTEDLYNALREFGVSEDD